MPDHHRWFLLFLLFFLLVVAVYFLLPSTFSWSFWFVFALLLRTPRVFIFLLLSSFFSLLFFFFLSFAHFLFSCSITCTPRSQRLTHSPTHEPAQVWDDATANKWPATKKESPFGQLPYLKVTGPHGQAVSVPVLFCVSLCRWPLTLNPF